MSVARPFHVERLAHTLGIEPAPNVIAARLGDNASRTTYKRLLRADRHGGWLTVDAADKLAVQTGRHPGEIWPEWWTA